MSVEGRCGGKGLTLISGDIVFPFTDTRSVADTRSVPSLNRFPTLSVTTNFRPLPSPSSSSSSIRSSSVSPLSEYTLHSISSSLSSTLFNLDSLTSIKSPFNRGFFTILPEAVYSTTSFSPPLFLPLRLPAPLVSPSPSSSSSSSSSDFPNSE